MKDVTRSSLITTSSSIQYFPTEIIRKILKEGSLNRKYSLSVGLYSFLESASLVSKHWRDIAQELIWRKADIFSTKSANLFLKSPLTGILTISHLSITYFSRDSASYELQELVITGKIAEAIFAKCKGVKWVYFGCINELEARIILSESMKGRWMHFNQDMILEF